VSSVSKYLGMQNAICDLLHLLQRELPSTWLERNCMLNLDLRHLNGISTLCYPWDGVHKLVDVLITNPTSSLCFCPK
jgi:hypothetical protein